MYRESNLSYARNIVSHFERDVMLKEPAKFYKRDMIHDGTLMLTKYNLVFVFTEENAGVFESIPLKTIRRTAHSKVFKRVSGLKITKDDGIEFGFGVKKPEIYIETLGKLIER